MLKSPTRKDIARAMTVAENGGPDVTPLFDAIDRLRSRLAIRACVVGVTGAPGVGKSTLVGALVRSYRRKDLTVGVVAVDPSSDNGGGALLGDRIRLQDHSGDDGVFVRSVATRGHLGGLALSTAMMIDILEASGLDVVIVETVGVGQMERDITRLAEISVFVAMPGAGDGIQAAKSGVQDLADIVVINKSDLLYAEEMYNDLRTALSYGIGTARHVCKTSAIRNDGIDQLAETILSLANENRQAGNGVERQKRYRFVVDAAVTLVARNAAESEILPLLGTRVIAGEIGLDDAIRLLLQDISENS